MWRLEYIYEINKRGGWNFSKLVSMGSTFIRKDESTCKSVNVSKRTHEVKYRHSSISTVSISAIFDLLRFINLSYFPPLKYY